jgi:hypothetical protein
MRGGGVQLEGGQRVEQRRYPELEDGIGEREVLRELCERRGDVVGRLAGQKQNACVGEVPLQGLLRVAHAPRIENAA